MCVCVCVVATVFLGAVAATSDRGMHLTGSIHIVRKFRSGLLAHVFFGAKGDNIRNGE